MAFSTDQSLISKREARLLRVWRDLVRPVWMSFFVRATLDQKQLEQQPPEVCMVMEIGFHFNFETFMPVEEPTVEPIPGELKDIASKLRPRRDKTFSAYRTSQIWGK